ncbi:nucleotide exchange factor GrpE [Epidermidibacterium keratini]|uniref:Protein GrpE n=1 Tax=Epidermidibacterium keratini TaxID=1891644 RepID=A0A7L4YQ39_9ACTN|nr:nucleotide exchange factor GrpE [Epidermidibacterium keratini]QHC00909.1 nucleotide exchange factor GrpE [Epidermidibacterium keratini]
MTEQNDKPAEREDEPIVIRDKRRVGSDGPPQTLEEALANAGPAPKEPAAPSQDSAGNAETERLAQELADRTSDLQRVTAEYANYRKRSDREREALVPMAQAALIAKLLPVLDDIDRADEHGDLTGGFKNVADSLRQALTQTGLEQFGAEGDAFDPQIHQAVAHNPSKDVDAPVVGAVMRKGYRHGDRVLREAMVAVTTPED